MSKFSQLLQSLALVGTLVSKAMPRTIARYHCETLCTMSLKCPSTQDTQCNVAGLSSWLWAVPAWVLLRYGMNDLHPVLTPGKFSGYRYFRKGDGEIQ